MSKRVRIGKLDSVAKVGAELVKVYAKARNGDIETADAGKLASVLLAVKACHEAGRFEERIAAIEQALGIGKPAAVLRMVPKP